MGPVFRDVSSVSPVLSVLSDPVDMRVRAGLEGLSAEDPGFWDFRGQASGFRTLFQYPGMMVPNMVSAVLDQLSEASGSGFRVFDPFCGSGTVLAEAVRRGWDATGVDVNPLAALLCQVRAAPFRAGTVADVLDGVLTAARRGPDPVPFRHPNVGKWFEPEVVVGLTRVRNQVLGVSDLDVRRFLWVALAETVRLVCNSRLSSPKLHMKPVSERGRADPVEVFGRVAERNFGFLSVGWDEMVAAGVVVGGVPVSDVEVVLGDVTGFCLPADRERPDLLVTSPPYGDNHTTVAYGQCSWLPLLWVDVSDIGEVGGGVLAGPTMLDSASLGGVRRDGLERARRVCDKSGAVGEVLGVLESKRRDHAVKVAAFFADLDAALVSSLRVLTDDGFVVVTVADRTVSGVKVPTVRAVQEIVEAEGAVTVAAASRNLPANRRAPTRNRFAERMDCEWMLVMRLDRG